MEVCAGYSNNIWSFLPVDTKSMQNLVLLNLTSCISLKICRSHTEGLASFTVYFLKKKSHVAMSESK